MKSLPLVSARNSSLFLFLIPLLLFAALLLSACGGGSAGGNTPPGGADVVANQAPTANAGVSQTVNEKTQVTLDGSASSDPDGTIASYAWKQTAGTAVTLSDASIAKPTFTAPAEVADETLTFDLTVTDNSGAMGKASVNIVVTPPPVPKPAELQVHAVLEDGVKVIDIGDVSIKKVSDTNFTTTRSGVYPVGTIFIYENTPYRVTSVTKGNGSVAETLFVVAVDMADAYKDLSIKGKLDLIPYVEAPVSSRPQSTGIQAKSASKTSETISLTPDKSGDSLTGLAGCIKLKRSEDNGVFQSETGTDGITKYGMGFSVECSLKDLALAVDPVSKEKVTMLDENSQADITLSGSVAFLGSVTLDIDEKLNRNVTTVDINTVTNLTVKGNVTAVPESLCKAKDGDYCIAYLDLLNIPVPALSAGKLGVYIPIRLQLKFLLQGEVSAGIETEQKVAMQIGKINGVEISPNLHFDKNNIKPNFEAKADGKIYGTIRTGAGFSVPTLGIVDATAGVGAYAHAGFTNGCVIIDAGVTADVGILAEKGTLLNIFFGEKRFYSTLYDQEMPLIRPIQYPPKCAEEEKQYVVVSTAFNGIGSNQIDKIIESTPSPIRKYLINPKLSLLKIDATGSYQAGFNPNSGLSYEWHTDSPNAGWTSPENGVALLQINGKPGDEIPLELKVTGIKGESSTQSFLFKLDAGPTLFPYVTVYNHVNGGDSSPGEVVFSSRLNPKLDVYPKIKNVTYYFGNGETITAGLDESVSIETSEFIKKGKLTKMVAVDALISRWEYPSIVYKGAHETLEDAVKIRGGEFIPCGGNEIWDEAKGLCINNYHISSVTPTVALLGESTVFKVTGNFPDNLDVITAGNNIGDPSCTNINIVSKSTSEYVFSCTPVSQGSLTVYLGSIHNTSIQVFDKSTDINPTDGIPDWWETKYGVTDANADDDNDQFSNIEEYKAGTDPTDRNDWPFIINAIKGDGQVKLVWGNVTGVDHYDLCVATATINTKTMLDAASCESYAGGSWHLGIANPQVVPNLTNGTTYHFVVLAKDASDAILRASNEAIATPSVTVSEIDQVFYARFDSGHVPDGSYIINADGTNKVKVSAGVNLAWSHDGRKFAFVNGTEIYVQNKDGSGLSANLLEDTAFKNFNGYIKSVLWSPDDRRLAFSSFLYDNGETGIYVINVDGTGLINITGNAPGKYDLDRIQFLGDGAKIGLARLDNPNIAFFSYGSISAAGDGFFTGWAGSYADGAWSPDGTKLVVGDKYVTGRNGALSIINADGSSSKIFDAGWMVDVGNVSWSPTGQKIAFTTGSSTYQTSLFVVNVDGSELKNLSKTGLVTYDNIVWSPDGSQLAIVSATDAIGWNHIFLVNTDGSGEAKGLIQDDVGLAAYSIGGWKTVEVSAAANPNPFTVQAADEVGTAFAVPTGATQCTFNAMGTWQWAGGAVVDADGIGYEVGIYDYLHTGSTYDLVAIKSGSDWVKIGSSANVAVSGGDTLRFRMNDSTGGFGDNSGALSVNWSCQ